MANKKIQAPSYCDRILVKSLPGAEIKHLVYDAAHQITTSDHSPVFSVFNVTIIPDFDSIEEHHVVSLNLITLTVSDVKGYDLSRKFKEKFYQASKPEPEIRFHPSFGQGEAVAVNGERDELQNCYKFPNDGIKQLKPFGSTFSQLRYHYLFIEVKDRKLYGQNDVLGEGVLSLREVCDDIGNKVTFVCNLMHQGLAAGAIAGKIKIVEDLGLHDDYNM